MVQVSATLSEIEAILFARTLNSNEKYWLVKTHENKKESHVAKRERFVIVRNVRAGERVVGSWGKLVEPRDLIRVTGRPKNTC